MHHRMISQIRHSIIFLIVLFGCGAVSLSASSDLYRKARIIIFDCDGVLVDTEYLKFLAWQEALASFNVDFSTEEYMPLVGHSSKNILAMIERLKQLKLPEQIKEQF